MRRFCLIILFTIIFSSANATPTPTPQLNICPGITIGADWEAVTRNAEFGVRSFSSFLSYDNALWLMFGSQGTYFRDVWKSVNNGAYWSIVTSSAGPSARAGQASVVYNDRIFISGGSNGSTYHNDVWSTIDGADWITATTAAAFPVRDHHNMIVYNGKLWIISGIPSSTVGAPRLHDVWYSINGVDWTAATRNAEFSGRGAGQVVVFNDGAGEKMWMIGGSSTMALSDVWCSQDGVTWTQKTPSAGFAPRCSHMAFAADGKMVVAGGFNDSGTLYDAWSSADGITWTKICNNIGTSFRTSNGCTVHDGQIYAAGGGESSGESEIIRTGCTQTPTPTQTLTPTAAVNCSGGLIGADWEAVTRNAEFGVRSFSSFLSYDNALWLMFGSQGTYFRDVWKSVNNGAYWSLVTSSAAPTARSGQGSAVYNDIMYISGGSNGSTYNNDVWSTIDGATWITATTSAAFPARDQHNMVVFDGKLWVISGIPSSIVGTPRLNDVWYSYNGVEWAAATRNAEFSGRGAGQVVVFDDGSGEKMWMIGGSSTMALSDVWCSQDGVTWTQKTPSAGFAPRCSHMAFAADGKIVVAGGFNDSGTLYDAWSSADGITWTKICNNIGTSFRTSNGCVIHNGDIYAAGGNGTTLKSEIVKTGCSIAPSNTATVTEIPTALETQVPTVTPTPPTVPDPTATLTAVNSEEPTPAITVTDDDTDVYPNPCRDHVKVVFNVNKKSDIKLYIYSFNGNLVDTIDYTTGWTPNEKLYQIRIDTSKYAPGMYFYVIQGKDEDGKLINYKSKKFLIKKK